LSLINGLKRGIQLLTNDLFIQVSGIRFAFDPDQPAGERVVKDSVLVHDNIPINLEHVSHRQVVDFSLFVAYSTRALS